MKWYTIDDEFFKWLKGCEEKIPNKDYGVNKFKPFFGSLFEVGEFVYLSQVSHAKSRHNKLKDNKDFVKLYDGSRLLAVVNLNYMFPVLKDKLIEVKYGNIQEFRTFSNEKEKGNYITILKKEKKEILIKNIKDKAYELYKFKYEYPDNVISKRCIDFKAIEENLLLYNSELNKEVAITKTKDIKELVSEAAKKAEEHNKKVENRIRTEKVLDVENRL